MYFMLLSSSESRLNHDTGRSTTKQQQQQQQQQQRGRHYMAVDDSGTGNCDDDSGSHGNDLIGSPSCSDRRRRLSFAAQRSYSCGDLSPNETDRDDADDSGDSWRPVDDRQSRGVQQRPLPATQQQLNHGNRLITGTDNATFNADPGDVHHQHQQHPHHRHHQQQLHQALNPSQQQQQSSMIVVVPPSINTNRDRRRSGWTDRKQKSRSFDFGWRSGMWSPVDGTCPAMTSSVGQGRGTPGPGTLTVDGQGMLTVPVARGGGFATGASDGVTSSAAGSQSSTAAGATTPSTPKLGDCRKSSPKLKLPPMFQMDSGSSYESYEAAECFMQQQLLRQQHLDEADKTEESDDTSPLHPTVSVSLSPQHHTAPPTSSSPSATASVASINAPCASMALLSTSPRRRDSGTGLVGGGGPGGCSSRRQWLALQDRKSRSFDSSFEDRIVCSDAPYTIEQSHRYLQTSANTTRFRTPVIDGAVPPSFHLHQQQQQQQYHQQPQQHLSGTRDRRRRLRQTQRKSRSLDVYDPYSDVVVVVVDARNQTVVKSLATTDPRFRVPSHCDINTSHSQLSTSSRPDVHRHQLDAIVDDSADTTLDATGRPAFFVRRSPGRGAQQQQQPASTTTAVGSRSDAGRSPPSPRERRPSPLRVAATEHQSRRSPRDGQPSPRSPVAVSPRDAATGGADRRITFAAQKSFSYDVPSVEPRPVVHYRKQSEPIVCTHYAGGSASLFLQRAGPGGLGCAGGSRMLPRLPISGARLEHHINNLSQMMIRGSVANQSVDIEALAASTARRVEFLTTTSAMPVPSSAQSIPSTDSAATSTAVASAATTADVKPTQRQISPSSVPMKSGTMVTSAGSRRASAAATLSPCAASDPVVIASSESVTDCVTSRPSAEWHEPTGRRQMFAGQKSLSYEVNQFQFSLHADSLNSQRSAVGDSKRDYFDDNEIQEFEVEHADGSATRVWHPPPSLDEDGDSDSLVGNLSSSAPPETESGGYRRTTPASSGGLLAPAPARRVRISAAGERRGEFAEQRSLSYEIATSSSPNRRQQRVPYELKIAVPVDGYSTAAVGRRSPREFGTRLVRQTNVRAPEAVVEDPVDSRRESGNELTATNTPKSGLTTLNDVVAPVTQGTRRLSPRTHHQPAAAADCGADLSGIGGHGIGPQTHLQPVRYQRQPGSQPPSSTALALPCDQSASIVVSANQPRHSDARQTVVAARYIDDTHVGRLLAATSGQQQHQQQRHSSSPCCQAINEDRKPRLVSAEFTSHPSSASSSLPATVEQHYQQQHQRRCSKAAKTADHKTATSRDCGRYSSEPLLPDQPQQQQVRGVSGKREELYTESDTSSVVEMHANRDRPQAQRGVKEFGLEVSARQHQQQQQQHQQQQANSSCGKAGTQGGTQSGTQGHRVDPTNKDVEIRRDRKLSDVIERPMMCNIETIVVDEWSSTETASTLTRHTSPRSALLATDDISTPAASLSGTTVDAGLVSATRSTHPFVVDAGTQHAANSFDDDDVGELVSDGIVTWRRKLPDIGRISRAAAVARQLHQEHHHRHQSHHTQQQQQQQQQHATGTAASRQQSFAADGRTMSLAVPSQFDYIGERRSVGGRRDAFAQQKSFSCEAATTRTAAKSTSPSPSPTSRSPVGSIRSGHDGRQSSGHSGGATSHHSDRRRRAMLGSKKKSYSLDDQLAAAHATGVYCDERRPSSAIVAGVSDLGNRRQQQQPYQLGSGRDASYDRPSPQQQQKKLMMLHTMKAVAHEQFDSPTGSSPSTAVQVVSSAVDELAVAAPVEAEKVSARSSSRLPIARLWDRLRPDRNRTDARTITAGGGRK